ncbi:hypothetical protein [Vampirovibrio chlorellavorus]|uniref:hypothetical protein n=1 Tax=Vampirovibrio chlorellavorus TaxID=758823 RepID=UPI0026ED47DE|nr:hypothetical protein [Vampirovibrio chlorellavorus]
MNVQFKGNNPLLALQQKKVAQQQQKEQQQAKLLNALQADTFEKKGPQFGASCCR